MATPTPSEIAALAAKHETVDELYTALSLELSGAGAFGKDRLADGKRLLKEQLEKLRRTLCTRELMATVVSSDARSSDAITAATLFVNVLPTSLVSGTVAALVGLLIARVGLREFCGETWQP